MGSKGIGLAAQREVEVFPFSVPSDVPDQPVGEEETLRGAKNRAIKAWNAYVSAHDIEPDYSIGLEGGISEKCINNMDCFAYICIYNGEQFGTAKTASFPLPVKISKLVCSGVELGDADDIVFGTENSKQASGTVGHLTNELISREEY